MNIAWGWVNPLAGLRGIGLTLLAMGIFCPLTAMSQVPPRFYWKTLSGANAVPLIVTSMSGNTNPFDAAHTVTPGADFEGTLARRCWSPWDEYRATSSRRAGVRPRSQ